MKHLFLSVLALWALLSTSCSAAPISSFCECLDLPYSIPEALCKEFPCSNFPSLTDCNERLWCAWRDTTSQNALDAHTAIFAQARIVPVTQPGDFPSVYVGIGFGLSNSVIIKGTSGYTIVDTSESVDAAKLLRAGVLGILGVRPVEAVIYTHSHSDHISGTPAWTDAFPPFLTAVNPPIFSHNLETS
jgi:beta-lactamase superfamily II metal-dependent hydrolase